MGKLIDWLVNIVGSDKAKWLTGVIAWFLLTVMANFLSPLTIVIINLPFPEVWISWILVIVNAGSMVIGAMIVVFIGKPIQPQLPEPTPAPVPDTSSTVPDTATYTISSSSSSIPAGEVTVDPSNSTNAKTVTTTPNENITNNQ